MKKTVLLLALVLLLSGCGKAAEKTEDANTGAETAYMEFLSGRSSVTTAECFRDDDQEYNQDGLAFGTYTIGEMRSAIAEYEMSESAVKYTFFDFGNDGTEELVLKFESVDPAFMNWTGIISFDGENLGLNYSYEDGYRTYSVLYDGGYLENGGSSGAGAHGYRIVSFDGKGFGTEEYRQNEYYGSFAESIEFDLTGDSNWEDEHAIPYESGLLVYEYIKDGNVKIAVSGGWSEDAPLRYEEEDYIGYLVSLGAEQISMEEMNALCSKEKLGAGISIDRSL